MSNVEISRENQQGKGADWAFQWTYFKLVRINPGNPKGIPKNPDYKSLDEFCNLPSPIFLYLYIQIYLYNKIFSTEAIY